MKLKYEDKIASFQPCPNKTHPINGTFVAYRFSHTPIQSEENFLPIAVKNISRISGRDRNFCCAAYGLSMFRTFDQLQNRINQLEEFNPRIRRSLGSLWVCLKLDSTSGSMTPPDKFGHFNLHEAVNFKGQNAIDSSGVLK